MASPLVVRLLPLVWVAFVVGDLVEAGEVSLVDSLVEMGEVRPEE